MFIQPSKAENALAKDVVVVVASDGNPPSKTAQPCPFEKYCFLIGFLLPPAWFLGSASGCGCCCCCDDTHDCGHDPEALVWKNRCRIAATLVLTSAIVAASAMMITHASVFGVRKGSGGSAVAQTQSDSPDAHRPGVPLNGTDTWIDAMSGVSFDSY